MSVIEIRNLSFTYEGSSEPVFDGVSFIIDSNWKLGFVGRNGKGKTTLLKILLGECEYSGSLISSEVFQYFPRIIPEEKWDSTADELIEEAYPGRESWRILAEIDKLGMDAELMYRPYRTLSFGERTRIQLAALFSGDNEFLLIDEPTNHLDEETKEQIKKYLNSKKGFILVSHDRDVLDACTDHTLALNRSSIDVCKGNFSSWYENKEKRDHDEAVRNEVLLREIKQLEASARKTREHADSIESKKIGFDPVKDHDRSIATRSYLGAKSKTLQSRVGSMLERQSRDIEEKKGLLKDIEKISDLKLLPKQFRAGSIVRAKDMSIAYDGRIICRGIDFEIKSGDRVLLKGRNGSGKSSIIKALLRQSGRYADPVIKKETENLSIEGELYLAPSAVISYCSQDTSFMKGTPVEFAEQNGIDKTLLFTILRKLDFERSLFESDIREYSEGQKKKTAIAASLSQSADLYIWDEPLNYIDIYSRMQIEKLLNTYKPTMLFVEHDSCFAEKIATLTVKTETVL